MTSKIFISYRREDSRGSAGRLYDQLVAHFGRERIFMDVDAIEPGLDFVEAIENAVNQTDVQLVVIGPTWLNAADAAGKRRLDNPEDFVRIEVASALKRNIRVIPVLVEKAIMPVATDLPDDLKFLSRRNALELSHSRFNLDVQRLIPFLEHALQQAESERKGTVEIRNDVKENTKPERAVADNDTRYLSDKRNETNENLQQSQSKISGKLGDFFKLYFLNFVFQLLFWLSLGFCISVIVYLLLDNELISAEYNALIIAIIVGIGSFFGFRIFNKKLREQSIVGSRNIKIVAGLIGLAADFFWIFLIIRDN